MTIHRGDPDWFMCGHPRTPENTKAANRGSQCRECDRARKRAAYDARLAAEGKTRVAVDLNRFPCGHPRTRENKTSQGRCAECNRMRAKAHHHAKVAAQGRELRVIDPDWFPCGHPRTTGNTVATRTMCRACHIERAVKQQERNPGAVFGNAETRRARQLAAKQCLREERRDPETLAYLAIIRKDPCSYCGGGGGTRDHIVPMSADGPNHWENYTGACLGCNAAKRDTPLLSYLLDRMDLETARRSRRTV